MTEHKYEQVEGAVEHTVQNTPARFGVKLESHGWFDGWGLCPDVRGKSVRIEFRRTDRFRKIQTIEVIGADGNDVVYERNREARREEGAPVHPAIFEEFVEDGEDLQRRHVALEAATKNALGWETADILRQAKDFEDWLAGGPTPSGGKLTRE